MGEGRWGGDARGRRRWGPLRLAGLAAALGACAPAPGGSAGHEGEGPYHGETRPADPSFDFTLSEAGGGEFRFREEAEGRALLLFFGYTHCPDVCPVQVANLAGALGKAPLEVRRRVKVVFVTVDPERDTPARLREWLAGLDPSFVGLRGPMERVDSIQAALGLPPAVRQGTDGPEYGVGHSARVVAFTADGRRVDYPFGTRQADWARDLPRLAGVEPGTGRGSG